MFGGYQPDCWPGGHVRGRNLYSLSVKYVIKVNLAEMFCSI